MIQVHFTLEMKEIQSLLGKKLTLFELGYLFNCIRSCLQIRSLIMMILCRTDAKEVFV